MPHTLFVCALLSFAAFGAQFDNWSNERQANVRGGGGDSGKCTIEVEVDGVAEVEIRGDRGRIRTLQGSPASWRRFECNGILPANPGDFRFKGVDGRGLQELVSTPGGRRSAVVRIEDPKGGRHGYTFDIEWRGSGGSRGGWGGSSNQELRYSGNGSGIVTNEKGMRETLSHCRVHIDRKGAVDVSFRTWRDDGLRLSGLVTQRGGNRIHANMDGEGISGDMVLFTDGPNRIREIRMSGGYPVRFQLNWHE